MRKNRRHKISSRYSSHDRSKKVVRVLFCMLIISCITIYSVNSFGTIKSIATTAAEFSAKLTAPQGGETLLNERLSKPSLSSNDSVAQVFANQQDASTNNDIENKDELTLMPALTSSIPSSSQNKASSVIITKPPVTLAPSKGTKSVKTLQMGPTKSNVFVNYQNIWVYNQTASHTADIAKQLAIRPDVHIFKSKGPQVLIVHTHTTESYSTTDNGTFDPNISTRNIDKTKSVCKVGDEVAKQLEANGIGVINDTTYNDYPEFTDAYTRSLAVTQKNMKMYPSIQVVLDIHRDSIEYSDGTRVKPTAVINGKKVAQLMIVAPCNESTSLPIPDWQINYRFGLRIQQVLEKDYPGLARPLNLCPRRYNMQASHGALLIEIGTESNTLDEAVYAGHLFGDALSKTLLSLKN
jgi:stage II sporulation protein P